jgi:hypothetical protein
MRARSRHRRCGGRGGLLDAMELRAQSQSRLHTGPRANALDSDASDTTLLAMQLCVHGVVRRW